MTTILDHEAIRHVANWVDRARFHQDWPEPAAMLQVTDDAIYELQQYRARLVKAGATDAPPVVGRD